MLKQLTDLAAAASKLAMRQASGGIDALMSAATNGQTGLEKLLVQATDLITPSLITVVCDPNSKDPNDYDVLVNAEEFIAILESGALVRPNIEVRAITDQLDRAILADRLVAAFEPVSARIQSEIDVIKDNKRRRLAREKSDAFWGSLAFELDAIILTLLTGGGFLIIMIGLAGFMYMKELPSILFRNLKKGLGLKVYDYKEDAELDALRNRLARDRNAVTKAVQNAEIIIDLSILDAPGMV